MGERLSGEKNTKYESRKKIKEISYTSERRSDIKYIFIEGFFFAFYNCCHVKVG